MGELKGYVKSEKPIHALHQLLEISYPLHPTIASYAYLEVLDETADCRDTIVDVLSRLYHEFHIGDSSKHLVVVGDAKTYQHLQAIKVEYGEKLSWLLPFPGDFHILMNFQPILSKVYFEIGLKQIALACGYKGETLTSLQKCSHFKNTHYFIFEVWEALFLEMFEKFLQEISEARDVLSELLALFDPSKLPSILQECRKPLKDLNVLFHDFVSSKTGPNWKFWSEFVQSTCFSYIALFCAIRSGNWNLRLAGIKSMVPLFSAFDRPTYRRVVPQHLADCILLPSNILEQFKQGGFSVNLTGRSWHSVGLDECHEMLINRDCKQSVVHPTKEFVTRQSLYFPFRSAVLKNVKKQLQLQADNSSELASKNRNLKAMENAEAMKCFISSSNILPTDNSSDVNLKNPFTGKIASLAQQEDLLSFTSIGQSDFNVFVQHVYLGESSVQPKVRQHRLKTFTTTKVTKRLLNNLQREKNLVAKCLKSRLIWAQIHGGIDESPEQQYLELPRAIATEDGIPHKGQKSHTSTFYGKRYGEKVIQPAFPMGWHPDIVVIEGMFMINSVPLRIHTTMSEYTRHLLLRYAVCYLKTGVKEVHVIFDDAGRLPNNPKIIEQSRRDASTNIDNHEHITFSAEMKVPSKWRELIQCRKCKRQLVVYMGDSMLQVGHEFLEGDQKLVVAGAGQEEDQDCAWYTTSQGIEYPAPAYKCVAEEGDTRVWLHVDRSPGTKKLIYSPDTDVAHIGLTNADLSSDEVIIQISTMGKPLKLFHMNNFIEAIRMDPNLSSIPFFDRPKVLQVIYIATGCDFVSFFSGIGKGAFLDSFYQHAEFITGQTPTEINGSLIHINPDSNGFFAFVRLVGVAYFQKNRGAFDGETPKSFFNSTTGTSLKERHENWYNQIRAKVWSRISFEDHLPPSLDALHLHWLRTTWVTDYWSQATKTTIHLLPIDGFGWRVQGTTIAIEWDSPENIQQVKNRVAFLTHGCNCTKGCTTKRCKCIKAGRQCGPGCSCSGCQNGSGEEGKISH